jgi:hypothetical protein
MKKLVLAFVALTAIATTQAQTNVQTHYDFGKDREYITTTVEMFKPDKWGNTFFFVDFDYNMGKEKSPSAAYFEIARCLKFWDGPISAHVEYNGGLFNAGGIALPIENAYLVGLDYGINNADFSKTLNIKALYKHIQGKQNSFQLTGVWGIHFLNKKMSFTGFADFWLEDFSFLGTNTVFISEPQLWYNFSEHFSAGTELELGNNFGGVKGFKACPTLALKWNF